MVVLLEIILWLVLYVVYFNIHHRISLKIDVQTWVLSVCGVYNNGVQNDKTIVGCDLYQIEELAHLELFNDVMIPMFPML